MAARVTNAQLMREIVYIKEKVDKLDIAVHGDDNGTKGLIRRQDADESNWRWLFRGFAVLGTILTILFGAFVNHSYTSWEASTRIENDIATLSDVVIVATPPTPTVASGPQRIVTPPTMRVPIYASVVRLPSRDNPTPTAETTQCPR